MNAMKKTFALFGLLLYAGLLKAAGFPLIKDNRVAAVYYGGNEAVVNTSVGMFIKDSGLVADEPARRTDSIADRTIVVGVLTDEAFKAMLARYDVSVAKMEGRWEAYSLQPVRVDGQELLFVMGSDPRGAAYGVLELSRRMGVSPWVWWADVAPSRLAELTIEAEGGVEAPSVQYRGVFLNDEDWGLMPWATRTFEKTSKAGAIGPETYAKIFELLLRLRANTIWPAMHECTVPFYLVKGNKEMAEKYGIVVSNSHAEPMMRTNTGEWNSQERGPFNIFTNKQQVLSYWEERVKELSGSDNIYTIGMRGIHDGRMQGVSSLDDETNALQQVIQEQRDMLQRNNPNREVTEIPQQFVPYKEVLEAYDNGLELPEDVSLIWCDDNHGYIMRLGDSEEQKRSGGGGVYYHISYWGKPHDYLWLASTPPGLIYAEMKRAWDNHARKIWILNVGDIKPGEYLTEFFLDMAWNINAFSGESLYQHQREWIERTFAHVATDKIHRILKGYYRLSAQRKPEHMGWNRVEDPALWSPENEGGIQPIKDSELSPFVFGDEMERRIKSYEDIATLSRQVYEKEIPSRLKAAYFQLVHYPVMAASAMNRKILYAQKSRIYASENPALATYYAHLAVEAYNEITALDYTYNKDMQNGKWELMMDMKPRDLPVFQQPVLPACIADTLAKDFILPFVSPLVNTAGTPVEGDRMIALNACDYVNDIHLERIDGLGHSGRAVRLPGAKKISAKQPHLRYDVSIASTGDAEIKIGIIPQHSVCGTTKRRYALVVDGQEPVLVETEAKFLSEKWAENVLRNQSLTKTAIKFDKPGIHTLCIYALDEELLVDQLMLEFDLGRKHYLIPTGK